MPDDAPSIGVLSPLLAGAYFGEILKGLARYVAGEGGRVIAVQTLDGELGDHFPDVPPFRTPLAWDQVDGFVVIIQAASEAFLRELRDYGKPVLMISHHIPEFACPRVMPDNRSGMAEAVTHLIGHGHQRVAFVGDMKMPDVAERYDAYAETMAAHGLGVTRDLVFHATNCCEDGGQVAGEALMAKGLPCSAVVAATDLNALGIIGALKRAGVEVPSDVAVVGFDDMDFASQLTPPLSSVRQNFDRLSELAGRLIVDMVQGRPVENAEHRVKTSFVARGSCGCTRSMAVPTPAGPGESPGARLRLNLEASLFEPQVSADQRAAVDAAATELTALFETGTNAGQQPAPARAASPGPGQVARQLFEAFPHHETIQAVLESIQQYRRDLLHDRFSDERLRALDECTGVFMSCLSRAELRQLADANERLQVSLRTENFVSMGLVGLRLGQVGLRSEGMYPKTLEWLAGTETRAACLALWEHDAPVDELVSLPLRVVGAYGPGTAQRVPVGTKVDLPDFPPVELLTAEKRSADEVVFVLPVRTASRYWGILAVVGPPESDANTGRDVYFQWSALLGIALDHEALVESLQQQSEDLANAYRRERDLVEEVKASEERYALAASAANDALWDWDAATGKFVYSPRWKSVLGYAESEIGDSESEWLDRVHPDDMPGLQKVLDETVRKDASYLQSEHRILAADGSYRWVACRAAIVRGPEGKTMRLVGSMTDIRERKELEERLRQAALHDSLTGLPNRTLFNDRLAQSMARARRGPNYQFCVVFLDLDGFKEVNDCFGHVAGDSLLVQVAERISARLRENDTAVRFGGDEFAVLLDDITGLAETGPIVERILEGLSQPYDVEGQQVTVSATAGVSLSSAEYEHAEDMVRDADTAMYMAKARRGAPAAAVGPAA